MLAIMVQGYFFETIEELLIVRHFSKCGGETIFGNIADEYPENEFNQAVLYFGSESAVVIGLIGDALQQGFDFGNGSGKSLLGGVQVPIEHEDIVGRIGKRFLEVELKYIVALPWAEIYLMKVTRFYQEAVGGL